MAEAAATDALTTPARLALGFAGAVAVVCIVTAVLVGRLEGAEIALLACASVAVAAAIVQAIAALARGQDRILARLEGVGGDVAGAPIVPPAPAQETAADVASLDDEGLKSLRSDVQDELERRRGRGGGPLRRPDPAVAAQAEARLAAARAQARDRTARKARPPAQIKRS